MAEHCLKCGRELSSDEIGIYKRMINRGATEFLCASCLAEKYGVEETFIYNKIEQFRDMGCTLFGPKEKNSENL